MSTSVFDLDIKELTGEKSKDFSLRSSVLDADSESYAPGRLLDYRGDNVQAQSW